MYWFGTRCRSLWNIESVRSHHQPGHVAHVAARSVQSGCHRPRCCVGTKAPAIPLGARTSPPVIKTTTAAPIQSIQQSATQAAALPAGAFFSSRPLPPSHARIDQPRAVSSSASHASTRLALAPRSLRPYTLAE